MPKSTKNAGDCGLAAIFILSLNVIQGVFVDCLVCLAFLGLLLLLWKVVLCGHAWFAGGCFW